MSGRREFMMEKENTFIGKDDLIHCSVCKEPNKVIINKNNISNNKLNYECQEGESL